MGISGSERSIRVAIVDDHLLVREGLIHNLDASGFDVVYACDDPAELLSQDIEVDVVLLDLDLGEYRLANVDEAAAMIDRGWSVIIMSAMGRPEVLRDFLKINVSGFVAKWESQSTLIQAITDVAEGADVTSREVAGLIMEGLDPIRPVLSDQEIRALRLYASGLKMSSVARQMNVSHHTAKEYIARVRAKYAAIGRPARTKTDLYREAIRDHLIDE